MPSARPGSPSPAKELSPPSLFEEVAWVSPRFRHVLDVVVLFQGSMTIFG